METPQAMSLLTALSAAALGRLVWKLPMIETPRAVLS
jgi:hypothetical protein